MYFLFLYIQVLNALNLYTISSVNHISSGNRTISMTCHSSLFFIGNMTILLWYLFPAVLHFIDLASKCFPVKYNHVKLSDCVITVTFSFDLPLATTQALLPDSIAMMIFTFSCASIFSNSLRIMSFMSVLQSLFSAFLSRLRYTHYTQNNFKARV